ncbi:MAG: DUF3575 domain-containing protein [Bacteroidales bacterium]|nr:DUF3575 domain-containing protein [Bacteroidales bacterium]MDD3990197.1 DUF3575 domain-containing protein [Bacteroidales bacterium]MDD4639151.1 DUF3575 domain-containing protein [Bacteroidales bacterium]
MKKLFSMLTLLCLFALQLSGQYNVKAMNMGTDVPGKNFIKTNLTSMLLKNFSLQYERALTKTISASVSYRFMPTTNVIFKDQISDYIDSEDENIQDIIDNANISNYAITPELRFYMGKKGYGRGFYIGTYYRYANFDFDNIHAEFETDEQATVNIVAAGNIKSHSAGILLGAQWALSRHLCLDWWIQGMHFGKASGIAEALPSPALTTEEQDAIRDELANLEIPETDITYEVSSNRVGMTLKGPWAGIRAGISLGIRF